LYSFAFFEALDSITELFLDRLQVVGSTTALRRTRFWIREHRQLALVASVPVLGEGGAMGDLLIEAQPREPSPGQMHAQLLQQLAFAGDAVQLLMCLSMSRSRWFSGIWSSRRK
jgi:hypothetical protein